MGSDRQGGWAAAVVAAWIIYGQTRGRHVEGNALDAVALGKRCGDLGNNRRIEARMRSGFALGGDRLTQPVARAERQELRSVTDRDPGHATGRLLAGVTEIIGEKQNEGEEQAARNRPGGSGMSAAQARRSAPAIIDFVCF